MAGGKRGKGQGRGAHCWQHVQGWPCRGWGDSWLCGHSGVHHHPPEDIPGLWARMLWLRFVSGSNGKSTLRVSPLEGFLQISFEFTFKAVRAEHLSAGVQALLYSAWGRDTGRFPMQRAGITSTQPSCWRYLIPFSHRRNDGEQLLSSTSETFLLMVLTPCPSPALAHCVLPTWLQGAKLFLALSASTSPLLQAEQPLGFHLGFVGPYSFGSFSFLSPRLNRPEPFLEPQQ